MLELITPKKYWNRVMKSKFVMSPHGGGWDCHRTTEILLLGSIPIIPYWPGAASAYKDLPVVIIHALEEITTTAIQRWSKELEAMVVDRAHVKQILSVSYWGDQLRIQKKNISSSIQGQMLNIRSSTMNPISVEVSKHIKSEGKGDSDSNGNGVPPALTWWEKYYKMKCNITVTRLCAASRPRFTCSDHSETCTVTSRTFLACTVVQ
jgi:hypothetical protein